MARKQTNPNGANQYLLDPRQNLCWSYFVDPKSKTFSNAYASAVKAGYEKITAKQITTEKWFSERVRRLNLLSKAEKVLDETLDLSEEVVIYEGGEPVGTRKDAALLKIKQDTAKFVAERLGKDEGYSSRVEQTGKDGRDLIPDAELKSKIDEAITTYAQRTTKDIGPQ